MGNVQSNPAGNRGGNLLKELHSTLADLPIFLRNQICEECGWDHSTYYRRGKLKGKEIYDEAEELIILTAYLQTIQIAFAKIEKYKKLMTAV